MKEYNYSQGKGGSSRLRLRQWGSIKMKIHCRLQEEGCAATTGENRCKALAWNMLVGYISTCYPSLTQLQSCCILTTCQIVQYWNEYLSYCPYVLVIILRPITVTGCFSEFFSLSIYFWSSKRSVWSMDPSRWLWGLFMCFSQVSELKYFPSALFWFYPNETHTWYHATLGNQTDGSLPSDTYTQNHLCCLVHCLKDTKQSKMRCLNNFSGPWKAR